MKKKIHNKDIVTIFNDDKKKVFGKVFGISDLGPTFINAIAR